MTIFTAVARATAYQNGVPVTATATATSTFSQDEADDEARSIANSIAKTQANLLAQGQAISETIQGTYTWNLTNPFVRTYNIQCKSICYGNWLFVAVAHNLIDYQNSIMTSPDGVNWTIRQSPIIGINNYWSSVCYGNGLFVAVADNVVNNDRNKLIITSPDGINWTSRNLPLSFSGNSLISVCYGNGYFVAVTSNNSVIRSPNGIVWSVITIGGSYTYNSICYGDGLFVIVGNDVSKISNDNGSSWSDGSYFLKTDINWKSVCFGDGVFVAVNDDNIQFPVAYAIIKETTTSSNKIIEWFYVENSGGPLNIAGQWNSVCYGNGLFVAVANFSSETLTDGRPNVMVMTSLDGKLWQVTAKYSSEEDEYNLQNGYTKNWQSVCYGNGTFIAVSSNENGPFITNGKQKTNIESSIQPFLAGGDGNIVTYPGFKGNLDISGNVSIDGGISGMQYIGNVQDNTYNNTAISNPVIQIGLARGTGDGASYTTFNNAINSWYGTGFISTYNKACNVVIDHRNGNINTNGSVTIGNIGDSGASAPLNIAAKGGLNPQKNGLYIYNSSTSGTKDKPADAICSIRTNYLDGTTNQIGSAFTSYDILGRGGWSTGIHNDLTYRIVPSWNNLRANNPALTIGTNGSLRYTGMICGWFSNYDSGPPFGYKYYFVASMESLRGYGGDSTYYWFVYPGYKITAYDNEYYGGSSFSYDNTYGNEVNNYYTGLRAFSFKLYYNGNEVRIKGLSYQ